MSVKNIPWLGDRTHHGCRVNFVLAALALIMGAPALTANAAEAKRPQALQQGKQSVPRDRMAIPKIVPALKSDDVHVHLVRDNVYMLVGGGTNIVVQIGSDGILVVDTLSGDLTAKTLEAIRKISPLPIHVVINTAAVPAHIAGNAEIAKAGSPQGILTPGRQPANLITHENAANWILSDEGQKFVPDRAGWPLTTYFLPRYDFHFNGTPIELLHQPSARTDGDSFVVFRRADVVATGNIFSTVSYPVIDPSRGGSYKGTIEALERLLDITIPAKLQEGGTFVIPGRGRLSDEGDVFEYYEMLIIIRDRMRDMVQRGMTLREIQEARPTLDYDGLYGAETGPWTTSMFVEALYRELTQ